MFNLNAKRILVTGGHGFLGSHIVRMLQTKNIQVLTPRRAEVDFIFQDATERYVENNKPDVIIHCAAYYGGMPIHEKHPGKIYYENIMMGTNLIEAARRVGVSKFVIIGSDCAYPGYLNKEVLKEEDLWSGAPHATAIDYGIVKRMLSVQAWAYKKEYGFNSIYLIPTNMYGPRDSFNPQRSHVVAALVRKFVEASMNNVSVVEVWGSGAPTRNFLYVEDAAEGIVLATEKYDDTEPMNLTTVNGYTIRELAETIKDLVSYKGDIFWNIDKPDGQMKKILDTTKMKHELNGWEPRYTLREGLKKTIEWYIENKELADRKNIII